MRSPAGTARTLQEFTLADQRRLWLPDPNWEIDGTVSEDYRRVRLSRLHLGEQFVYVFDLDDDWAHLCTAGPQRIDPVETLGILPAGHCRTSAGVTSPTSTDAAGTATMGNRPRRAIPV